MQDRKTNKTGWAIYIPTEVRHWYSGLWSGWYSTEGSLHDAVIFPTKKEAKEVAKRLVVNSIVVKVEIFCDILFSTAEKVSAK